MATKDYPQAVALSALHEELQAAIPALVTVDGQGRRGVLYTLEPLSPTGVRVTVPDSVAQSAVDAVLAAHNPNRQTTAEQAAATDGTSLSDLQAQAAAITSGIATIRQHMAAIQAGPASPTAAQTGTALKVLAGDLDATVVGLGRIVAALGVLVRRQSGT